MPADETEVVRRFFEALVDLGGEADADDDTSWQLASDDLVYVEDPRWPGAGTYRGRAAVRECWANYDEMLGEGAAVSVEEVHAAGDGVVAIVRFSGRSREGGIPYDHTWGYVCRTEDDRVSYFRAYLDPAQALESAGLRP